MFKFLGQLILLGFAYAIFATALSSVLCHGGFTSPRDNALSDMKLDHAIANKADLLIFGSSRVHRHFNPEIIEAALGEDYSVFNMGVPGMWPPRQDRFVERALKQTNPRVIVVELNSPLSLSSNFRSSETLRSISPQSVTTSVNTKLDSSGSTFGKARFLASFVAATAYKYLGIGLLRTEFFEHSRKDVESALLRLESSESGFLTLDKEMEINASIADRSKPTVEGLLRRSKQNVAKYTSMNAAVSQTLLEKCARLIEESEKQNCRVIFVLSPRIVSPQLEIVYPVFKQLPEANRIDMSNPETYPDFYDLENSFDSGHMNESGSAIFSKAFGTELEKLLGEQQVSSRQQF